MENVNHKNYYLKTPEDKGVKKVKETITATVEPVEEEIVNPYTEEYLYDLVKYEQIKILYSLGFTTKEIKALRYEKDRVNAILDAVK